MLSSSSTGQPMALKRLASRVIFVQSVCMCRFNMQCSAHRASQAKQTWRPRRKQADMRSQLHSRRHVCSASSNHRAASGTQDPFADKTTYHDSPLERIFIRLFTQKIADQLGPGVYVPQDTQYEDFVRVSKDILRGRSTSEQHALVRQVLMSLLPPGLPAAFKALFRPTQWAAEVNAAVAAFGFHWLVGESEVRSQEVEVAPGVMREQRSVVHIKKCRYLESSGCVGLCTNMCKIPTQSFFTNDFGLPLTMNPNFDDLSCDMIFGQTPPPLEEDPVYTRPCFVPQCSLAATVEPCPKTDSERDKQRRVAEAVAAASSSSSSSTGSLAVSGAASEVASAL